MTDPPAGPLRVAAATRMVYDDPLDAITDPRLPLYLTDLVAPYGLQLRTELLDQGAGRSFGEMAEPLIATLVPTGAAAVDLLVLAYAMHDLQPGRATAIYLSHLCPGRPLAFSLCDQGAAAAFSGLRLLQVYAGTGDCRRALLLVAEQATLHYEPAAPAVLPSRHAAVALLLDGVGPAGVRPVRQHTAVEPDRAAGLLCEEVSLLVEGRTGVTLILNSELADPRPAEPAVSRGSWPAAVDELVAAPAGQPCTGTWWALVDGFERWSKQARLVLMADYDPILGYLSICAVDFAAVQAVPASPLSEYGRGVVK